MKYKSFRLKKSNNSIWRNLSEFPFLLGIGIIEMKIFF